MKKQHLALLGGAGLILLFALATYLYRSQRAQQIQSMTRSWTPGPPLVRDYSQSMGAPDAKVVIVEFFDPGCETCRVFAKIVKQVLATRHGKVRLVLRYAPFHDGADTMVKILEAARQQGKYEEVLQVMFDSQPHWASHHQPQPDKIWEFLPASGVNIEQLRSDMNAPMIAQIIQQDLADAKTLGVRKTPEFFVNGKPLPRFGLEPLMALIEAEIAVNYGR